MSQQAYRELSSDSNSLFVVIAGNIGSGKTTLTKKLSERLGWRAFFESVQDNPYLEDFYSDMSRWSFALQVYFLTHRFNTHKNIEVSGNSSIQDRSIFEDAHIFARALYEQGDLHERDYENYLNLYQSMVRYLGAPTLMVFLRRSVPKLMDRISQRGRDYESSIPKDYIERLNHYYDQWYEDYDLGPSIIVDTDDLDFMENESDFDNLVHKIHDSIAQKDMFFPLESRF